MTSDMRNSLTSPLPDNCDRSFGGKKKFRTKVRAAEGSEEGRKGRSKKGTSRPVIVSVAGRFHLVHAHLST